MIDVKELRIGNWLANGKVTSISEDEIKVYDGYTTWSSKRMLPFEPVILTPEILVKCGFERKVQILGESSGIPFEYIDYRLNNFVCIHVKDTFEVEFAPSFDNVSDRTHVCTIQYLHQLQNLFFALTQTELKIEI